MSGDGARGEDADALAVVLINAPQDAAPKIARALVERELAACVNVVPAVLSVYRWEGKVVEEGEATLLVKTRRALVQAITEAMKGLHPYEVPEVIALPLVQGAGHPAYLAWVRENTTGP